MLRKPRHKYPDCRTKEKIPKYEWAINKAQKHIQSNNDEDKSQAEVVYLLIKDIM